MFWPKILFDFIFFVHSVANETVNLTLKLDFVNSNEAENAKLASKNFIAYTLKSARGIIFRALETAI